MRILITGAAGFVGSHLVDYYLAKGADVIGVDNLITGSERNIAHLKREPKFEFIQHDVCNPFRVEGPIDRIFHLGSPASPNAYAQFAVETLRANSEGTANMLDMAVAKGARFLFASTSEIYGEPDREIQREDYWGNVNPIGLRSVYEEAKRFGEAITMAYFRKKGADTRIVRMYNTFGPRMTVGDGRVVPAFCVAALRGETIQINGDGTQGRCFCYVSDTLRAIDLTIEGDFHEPINIGQTTITSIVALAREIIGLVPGTAAKVVFQPSLAYDPRQRKPDITRARQLLNWQPQVSLKDGLAKVIEYYRTSGDKM